jgi:hypothetical protein
MADEPAAYRKALGIITQSGGLSADSVGRTELPELLEVSDEWSHSERIHAVVELIQECALEVKGNVQAPLQVALNIVSVELAHKLGVEFEACASQWEHNESGLTQRLADYHECQLLYGTTRDRSYRKGQLSRSKLAESPRQTWYDGRKILSVRLEAEIGRRNRAQLWVKPSIAEAGSHASSIDIEADAAAQTPDYSPNTAEETEVKPQPPVEAPPVEAAAVSPPRTPFVILLDDRLAAALSHLADYIRRTLISDMAQRQVSDEVVRLLLRWANGPDELSEHWPVIRGDRSNTAPIDLSGSLDTILETFEKIPSRRLVVLGEPGSGKSVWARCFAHELLWPERWQPGSPVPVVVQASSWLPSKQSFDQWIEAKLVELDRRLAAVDEDGLTLAQVLLEHGHILPVVDGFDEIAPALQADALKAINQSLANRHRSIVITSQLAPYHAAVTWAYTWLTGAAVIRLEALTLDDVKPYLTLTTRQVMRDGRLTTKWDHVFERLDNQESLKDSTALRTVLTSPLMVSLARAIYSRTHLDPIWLLDQTVFSQSEIIETHLLDAYLDAAYSPEQPEDPRVREKQWSSTQAHKWFGRLALQLHRNDSEEIQWWQLRRDNRLTVAARTAINAVAISGIPSAIMIPAQLHVWPPERFLAAYLLWITACFMSAFVPLPSTKDGRSHSRRHIATLAVLAVLLAGWGIVKCQLHDTTWHGLFLLPAVLLLAVFSPLVSSGEDDPLQARFEVDPGRIDNPIRFYRSTLRTVLLRWIVQLGCYVTALIILLPTWENVDVKRSGIFLALPVGLTLSAGALLFVRAHHTSWLLDRLALRCPRLTLAFLADGQRREVLRQSGASYQFRHILLQDWLALQELERRIFRSRRSEKYCSQYVGLAYHFAMGGKLGVARRQLAILTAHEQVKLNMKGPFSLEVRQFLALSSYSSLTIDEVIAELGEILTTLDNEVHRGPVRLQRWWDVTKGKRRRLLRQYRYLRVMLYVHYNFGRYLEEHDRLDEAVVQYETIIRLCGALPALKADDPTAVDAAKALAGLTKRQSTAATSENEPQD